MTRDYQQSEDLTHDTYVKAYKNLASFKGKSSVKSWLFSIAHNVTIDYLRKRKAVRLVKDTMWFTQKYDKPLPEEIVQLNEDFKELHKALNELKASHRAVIIMRKIKGFSIKETCEILGWSESKVKSTLHRAMPALEKKLKQRVVEHGKSTSSSKL
ncbi:RNA polymerase sigma factor [Evansella halocellulosilytica]|uniref:RNA polymerase sigma factor n=1 Tax=Evansella halocellulosilytica TaxID=2011013 RepID=UPI0011554FFC|nr:RNA polymerase sigma factor [Evansella halocellulosilytica]